MIKSPMEKIALIIVIVALIFLMDYYNIDKAIGFSIVDVVVQRKTQGTISLEHDYRVNLTFHQHIKAGFLNTGSTNFTARIEIYVYKYNNNTLSLDLLATYYDSYANLEPGENTSYETSYLPYETGLYYIKVRVPYEYKVEEYWGSFYSVYDYGQVAPVIFIPTSYGGGVLPGNREYGVTGMDIFYNDHINMYPGKEVLFSVRVNNTGTISLNKLSFYSTTTEYISFGVNPKEIHQLLYGESDIFLVSLKVAEGIPAGEYDFYFEVLGSESKRIGNILLNVSAVAISIKDDVSHELFSYEFMITEMEQKIYDAYKKGYNTTIAETYQENAKKNLEQANIYFDEGEYEDARSTLQLVKRDMENVVFELALLSMVEREEPILNPLLVGVILLVIFAAVVIFVFLSNKKKERRPKLIREFMESET